MDGAQVGVLEQSNQVRLRCLLKSADSGRLEMKVRFELLCHLSHETLERQLAKEEFGRFLVTTDLTKCDGARTVPVRLFDAA